MSDYMKNKYIDLHNHLFEQLERLNNEQINPDELKIEVDRSKAMCDVAAKIIDTGKLVLSAEIAIAENNLKINSNKYLIQKMIKVCKHYFS